MALKARLEALEGLDDSVKGLYRQDGEVFLLDVEGVDGWALEDIGGLRTTVQKERKAAREAAVPRLRGLGWGHTQARPSRRTLVTVVLAQLITRTISVTEAPSSWSR